jgi:hypothetical protein
MTNKDRDIVFTAVKTTDSPSFSKKPWLRPVCWILGHDWYVLKINIGPLKHIKSNADIDRFCTRCGCKYEGVDDGQK